MNVINKKKYFVRDQKQDLLALLECKNVEVLRKELATYGFNYDFNSNYVRSILNGVNPLTTSFIIGLNKIAKEKEVDITKYIGG